VMVGRGSLGNPWIFTEIKAALRGEEYAGPSIQERKALLLEHIRAFRDAYGERRACGEMKKSAAWYLKGMAGASAAKARIFASSSSLEIEEIVDGFFI